MFWSYWSPPLTLIRFSFPNYLILCSLKEKAFKTNVCSPNITRCVAFHWSMVDLPETVSINSFRISYSVPSSSLSLSPWYFHQDQPAKASQLYFLLLLKNYLTKFYLFFPYIPGCGCYPSKSVWTTRDHTLRENWLSHPWKPSVVNKSPIKVWPHYPFLISE